MDIELLPRQVVELTEIASQTGQGTDELVRQAVDQLLAEKEWLRKQARVGLEEIERGEFIDEEEMSEWVERLFDGRR